MSGQKEPPQIIPTHGGYSDLQLYQMAEIVFDATVAFCDRFMDRRSRIHEPMVQANRVLPRQAIQGWPGVLS